MTDYHSFVSTFSIVFLSEFLANGMTYNLDRPNSYFGSSEGTPPVLLTFYSEHVSHLTLYAHCHGFPVSIGLTLASE